MLTTIYSKMGVAPAALRFTLFLSVVLISVCSPAFADKESDFYIQQATDRYFKVPQDAKSLSMAGASAQVCDSAACIFMNAAGLGFLKSYEISGSFGGSSRRGVEFLNEDQIDQTERSGFIAAAIPIGDDARYGVFGLAYSRYNGNTNDSISTNPDGHNRTLGYSLAPYEYLSFGYSLTFLDDQLRTDYSDLHSHARFLHLFSTQARLGDGVMLGGTFQLGIGQSDTEDFVLGSNGLSHLRQYSGDLALSKKWERFTSIVSFSYSRMTSSTDEQPFSIPVVIGGNETGNEYNLGLGFQYEITEPLALRAGYRYRNSNYSFNKDELRDLGGTLGASGWTAGLGYVFNREKNPIRLDYGCEYSSAGYGTVEQLLSLSVPF